MVSAYLGLGSNLGDRQANLDRALDLLAQRLRLGEISSVYETEPVGNINQPRFLNLACRVATGLAPAGLLALAKGIESKLGRVFTPPHSPRPIDIDILFYGSRSVNTGRLRVPHPGVPERAFVLVPLAELAPDFVHPGLCRTVRELLERSGDAHWVHPANGGSDVRAVR